jgi:addiction module RelE/StbE family toxin
VRADWTPAAVADLDELVRHIAKDNVDAAFGTEDRVLVAIRRLERYPASGRVGVLRGTRELVVVQTPYLVVYRIAEDAVKILRVIHGAQSWPPT